MEKCYFEQITFTFRLNSQEVSFTLSDLNDMLCRLCVVHIAYSTQEACTNNRHDRPALIQQIMVYRPCKITPIRESTNVCPFSININSSRGSIPNSSTLRRHLLVVRARQRGSTDYSRRNLNVTVEPCIFSFSFFSHLHRYYVPLEGTGHRYGPNLRNVSLMTN